MVEAQFKVCLKEPADARFLERMNNKTLLSEAGIEYVHSIDNDTMLLIGTDEMNIATLCEFLALHLDPITNVGLITQTLSWEPEWNREDYA